MQTETAHGAGPDRAPALLLLALVGMTLGTPIAQAAPLFPGEARGEIRFTANAGLFLDPASSPEVYFCLAVPLDELRCDSLEGRAGPWAQIRVELSGLDGAGEARHTRRQALDLPCAENADEGGHARRLVHLRAPWPTPTADFEIRVLDQNAVRTGLIYQLRGEERRGILRGSLDRPSLAAERGLSSCLFLWDFEPTAFERRGRLRIAPADSVRERIEPNPSGSFGLRRETLVAYVEIYGTVGSRHEVRARIRSLSDGKNVLGDRADLELPWARTALVYTCDVAGLLTGSYDLEITLHSRDADVAALSTHAHFQMLWRPESWGASQATQVEEMRLLLDPEALERYRAFEPGAREAFSESLWADADGFSLPGSWSGPARALFAERVAAADRRYAASLLRGSQTDRGRVYVRFGEPDEVKKELLPLEEDQIANFMESEIGDAGRLDGESVLKQNPLDASAYEVWYYVHRGEPLIPDAEPPGRGHSLTFIFADPLGNGQYRLIYTNLYGGLR